MLLKSKIWNVYITTFLQIKKHYKICMDCRFLYSTFWFLMCKISQYIKIYIKYLLRDWHGFFLHPITYHVWFCVKPIFSFWRLSEDTIYMWGWSIWRNPQKACESCHGAEYFVDVLVRTSRNFCVVNRHLGAVDHQFARSLLLMNLLPRRRWLLFWFNTWSVWVRNIHKAVSGVLVRSG